MIIQKIVFPENEEESEALYWRLERGIVDFNAREISLEQGGILDLTTYFNSFSAGKWKKYTKVQNLNFTLDFCGRISVTLYHKKIKGHTLISKTLQRITLKSDGRMSHTIPVGPLPKDGVIGVVVTSREGNVRIFSGHYGTSEGIEKSEVHIGIGICTFKRETYVKRNMDLLCRTILNHPEALSNGHYSVCISDNAGTLDPKALSDGRIRVVTNKNLGGVGGFTRTMIEHLKRTKELTHILLMDDDAMITPASLERNYMFLTLLRPEYKDYVIGGALIRLDQPVIQYESGARWNRGAIEALKKDYDLSRLEDVVRNETEEKTEYTGWWYSCIPVSQIREKKLPLPLFLHRDDIEFGLRAKGFILLNGICVWHEAFQNKMPGAVEYYDIRNLGIINAIHYPDYSKKEFKKELFIAVSSNIGKYRYKYAGLNLKGAVDFLRGFEWFSQTDTMELHKALGKYNYISRPLDQYVGYHGLTKEDMTGYQKSEAVPPLPSRIFRILTMNGTFFPAKSNKPKVVIPWPNIYELYRQDEVIYVDNSEKGAGVKRSVRNLCRAYIQLFKVFRLIDKRFDEACRGYRQNYEKLISHDFWNKYLDLEVKKKYES